MAGLMFPGLSETGEWSYDELLDLGFLPDTLEKIGIIEGQKAMVQFDSNNKPYLTPTDSGRWEDQDYLAGNL